MTEVDLFNADLDGDGDVDKYDRLVATRMAGDPEDGAKRVESLADDLLGGTANDQQVPERPRPKISSVEEGAEEHWNLVMKKLAPSGYKKSPQWQKKIIERVIKTMTKRETEAGETKTKSKNTVDLSAIGLAPDTIAAIQAEEERVQLQMKEMPDSPSKVRQTPDAASEFESTKTSARPRSPTSMQEKMVNSNNQVHYYIRAIQMEQLQQQDLTHDVKQMSEEIDRATKEAKGGQQYAISQRARVTRQITVIKNRCEALMVKASKTNSENAQIRLRIDDCRKEKQAHVSSLDKLRATISKMDEDISFLTQSAHAALDQREKVKGKFLAAQRDAHQERELKLGILKDLMQRATMLDEDWGLRDTELADAEETRRRRLYMNTRQRRGELETAETRFGFLANQVKGWDSEFQRLQSFTGMDTKYEPGHQDVVDEITNRFLEKERANTSLLRYLHEQQAELTALQEEQRKVQLTRNELNELIDAKSQEKEVHAADELEAIALLDNERCSQSEMLLEAGCHYVQRIVKNLWRKGEGPSLLDAECNVHTLEEWLRALDRRVTQMHDACTALILQADVPPAPVIVEWCAPRPRKQHVPVPEIHDALVAQAEQRKIKSGDQEDEEDDEAEKLREKESKITPFNRVKVDRAKERQQIVDWARKRQGKGALSQQEMIKAVTKKTLGSSAMAGSPAQALRSSMSAPELPGLAKQAAAPSYTGEQQRTALDAAAYTAQHGAAPPERGTAEYGKAVRAAAAASSAGGDERAQLQLSAAEALASSAPDLDQVPSRSGSRGSGRGGRGVKPPPQSSSMPWLNPKGSKAQTSQPGPSRSTPALSSTAPPKDLGTMIYLLGTNANSTDARKMGSR